MLFIVQNSFRPDAPPAADGTRARSGAGHPAAAGDPPAIGDRHRADASGFMSPSTPTDVAADIATGEPATANSRTPADTAPGVRADADSAAGVSQGVALPGRGFTLAGLPAVAADVAEHLTAAGFADEPHLRQTLALAEEVGEFVGAVRRYYGMARRVGSFEDVEAELADVVVTAFVTAHTMGIDLERAVAAKLDVIYTRGWRDRR